MNKPDTDLESEKDENGEKMSTEPLTPVQIKLASEWVPLELSFGIPLFNETSNAAVCDRVSVGIRPGGYFYNWATCYIVVLLNSSPGLLV